MALTVYPVFNPSAILATNTFTYTGLTAQISNSVVDVDILSVNLTLTSAQANPTADLLFMLVTTPAATATPGNGQFYGEAHSTFTASPGQLIWTLREGASNNIVSSRTDHEWDIFPNNPTFSEPLTALWFQYPSVPPGSYTFTLAGRQVTAISSGSALFQTCSLTAYVWR